MKKIIMAALCLLFATPCMASVDVDALITKYATKYDVDDDLMTKVIRCESGFVPDIGGDHNQSWGLAQFYLPAKNTTPDGTIITKEMAIDPDIALDSMAWYFSLGRQSMWSCLKMVD